METDDVTELFIVVHKKSEKIEHLNNFIKNVRILQSLFEFNVQISFSISSVFA